MAERYLTSMDNLFFEHIDNVGLIRSGRVDYEAIAKLSAIDIIDFAEQSAELTSARDQSCERGLLVHSASPSLSGGKWPCGEVRCRLRRARHLAQFAAFYSDKVYIHNFLTDHLDHLRSERYPDEALMQFNLANDLRVLQTLRPFIESSLIVPIVAPQYCPHCFVSHILKQDNDQVVARAPKSLSDRYSTECRFSLTRDKDGSFALVIHGPEDLLEHGSSVIELPGKPSIYSRNAAIRGHLKRSREATLSRRIVTEAGLDIAQADRIFQNVIFQLAVAQCLRTKFLTGRSIDIQLARALSVKPEMDGRADVVEHHLTSLVPFIASTRARDILKIREHEADAFIAFRNVLNRAIDACMKQSGAFSQADADAIYQDILRPGVAKLNRKMHAAQKSLMAKSGAKTLAWVGAITFGLYAGFLPAELAPLAQALGLTKVLAEIAEGAIGLGNAEKAIQNEDLYFLWKVSRKGQMRTVRGRE